MHTVNTLSISKGKGKFRCQLTFPVVSMLFFHHEQREGVWQTEELFLKPMRDQDVAAHEQRSLFFSAKATLLHFIGWLLNDLSFILLNSKSKS